MYLFDFVWTCLDFFCKRRATFQSKVLTSWSLKKDWTALLGWTATKTVKDLDVAGVAVLLRFLINPNCRSRLYIYIYICTHTHTYIYIYIYIHIHVSICRCTCAYVYIHMYMYIWIWRIKAHLFTTHFVPFSRIRPSRTKSLSWALSETFGHWNAELCWQHFINSYDRRCWNIWKAGRNSESIKKLPEVAKFH